MPSTNVEFVTELMEFSAHGALVQAFVMQALEQYASRVAAMDPEALDTPMVSGRAWHGCAVEVRDKLARRLGRNEASPPTASSSQGHSVSTTADRLQRHARALCARIGPPVRLLPNVPPTTHHAPGLSGLRRGGWGRVGLACPSGPALHDAVGNDGTHNTEDSILSISIMARAQARPDPNRSPRTRPNHSLETRAEQDACTYHLVRVSRNRKTGPIPVTTTSANSCPPNCSFKGGGCYAESGPLAIHWKCVSEGRRGYSFDELLQEIATLRRHALWRHNQAGDLTPEAPGVIDSRRLTRLAVANRGRRGFTYTHYLPTPANRIAIRQANELGFTVNLSAESLGQADEYLDHGVAPVVVVLPANAVNATRTPAGRRVIVCPASTGNTDCLNCGCCQQRDRASVVGFPAHGSGAKRVEAIFFKEVRP